MFCGFIVAVVALALLTRYCGACLAEGTHTIATHEVNGAPLCRPCAELYDQGTLPFPEPAEVRTEASEYPSSQTVYVDYRSILVTHAVQPRTFLNPVLWFPWNMLRQALFDARQCRCGSPTAEALAAVEWLEDDTERIGGFVWCCHWLSQDPAVVREQGLCNPHSPGRLGGLVEVRRVWARAAERYKLYGVERRPQFGGRGRGQNSRLAVNSADSIPA